MNFATKQINIKTIVLENFEFLIPVYQRPYVWDDIEIKKLLEDLKYNFENNTTEYFVGNTYVIKSSKENRPNQYEVIDGQQRFTTFWLTSLCFKTLNIDTELIKYLEIKFDKHSDIRFDFDIRKEVYDYLKGLLDGTSERRFHDASNEFLKNIAKGIETIKSFLNSEISKEKLPEFGKYIYEKVKFIFNEAPENTDLNALFVALGTSGIQLQQSDILKARLLGKLKKENNEDALSVIQYAKIWEACENMNNYFESNVKAVYQYDTSLVQEQDFASYKPEKFKVNSSINNQENFKELTITDIIKIDKITTASSYTEAIVNSSCRSIISFNLFLLHVLRIYKIQKKIKTDIDSLDGKKLLETFNLDEIDDVAGFIELMWKIRFLFDKYVVKWLKDENESFDDEEKLLLSYINTSKNEDKAYFSRKEKEFSNLQMLQSVLYFNNIPNQVWLSPFLYFLLKNSSEIELKDEIILQELELIDNILLPGDKKQMTWQILTKTTQEHKFESIKDTLNLASGTSFNHYWFYKLEYILWKNWKKRDEDEFKRYRITSKNSIEHVFPQNDEYRNKLIDLSDNKDWLNSFGNLALLSVGQNSTYSNQDVEKKRIDFQRKNTYDSLKLANTYNLEADNWEWNSEQIKKHQEEMIILLENHYQ